MEETGLPEEELLSALENIRYLTEKFHIFQKLVYKKFQTQEVEIAQEIEIHQLIF